MFYEIGPFFFQILLFISSAFSTSLLYVACMFGGAGKLYLITNLFHICIWHCVKGTQSFQQQ